MKLYIAGPMTGLPEYNYPAFRKAQAALRAKGYEVLSPHEIGEKHGTEMPYEFYLREDLKMLLECDALAYMDDYMQSKGARKEIDVASHCGMRCAPVNIWLAMRPPDA